MEILILIVIAVDVYITKRFLRKGMNQQIQGLEALYEKLDGIEKELKKINATKTLE